MSEVLSLFSFASQLSGGRVTQSSKSEVTFSFISVSFLVYCEMYKDGHLFIYYLQEKYLMCPHVE